MFKKTMTFDDLEGNETTETFYFNYTKLEVAEMLELDQLEEKIERLTVDTERSGLSQVENTKQAYEIFRELILKAYGEKGENNVTFVKNEKTRTYLESHVAFVDMIFEMLGDTKLAAEFMEKCLPAKLVAEAKAQMGPKKTDVDISELVAEAARRQEDPETRIERTAPLPSEMTAADIDALDEETFRKLDIRKLEKDALVAAFARKNKA